MKLLELRHKLQAGATAGLDPAVLPDAIIEADECYVNAGKKGVPHRDPDDPPRHRANERRGHGAFENDRPPVAATIGRDSGRACLHVVGNSDRRTLEGLDLATTALDAMVHTDEWRAYGRAGGLYRGHATVNHGAGEWPAMTTATGYAKCTSTRWRRPGRA